MVNEVLGKAYRLLEHTLNALETVLHKRNRIRKQCTVKDLEVGEWGYALYYTLNINVQTCNGAVRGYTRPVWELVPVSPHVQPMSEYTVWVERVSEQQVRVVCDALNMDKLARISAD